MMFSNSPGVSLGQKGGILLYHKHVMILEKKKKIEIFIKKLVVIHPNTDLDKHVYFSYYLPLPRRYTFSSDFVYVFIC